MTMFNLRLGIWVADPNHPTAWLSRGPQFALKPLLDELFGRITGNAKYVFISDGGHYDNLGLYEMLRRRCRHIVVSDASHDPNYSYQDLARVLRQAAIDMGIRVTFNDLDMLRRPRGDKKPSGKHWRYWASAEILYPEQDEHGQRCKGWLLYIKPGYQGRCEPADVRGYAANNPAFPHDSTMNQFFGESQFESYRQLGRYVIAQMIDGEHFPRGAVGSLSELFDKFRYRKVDTHHTGLQDLLAGLSAEVQRAAEQVPRRASDVFLPRKARR
jgi:hypothetical protein